MRLMLPLSNVLALLLLTGAAHAQMLTGWAQMPAATFSPGPTSGQFAAANPYGTNLPPFVNRQPVQGFSGVLAGPRKNVFHFLVDNGFGAQNNSADAALRAYALRSIGAPAKAVRAPSTRRIGTAAGSGRHSMPVPASSSTTHDTN